MERNFTSQLLIKHLYNETTASERAHITDALAKDPLLQQEFAELEYIKSSLDEAGGESPCAMSIHNILQYSKERQAATV